MKYYSYLEYDKVVLVYKFKELIATRATSEYYDFEMAQLEKKKIPINEFDRITLERLY